MRIGGSGSGFGGFQGGRKDQSDSFRRKHSLGQKLRGVLLKNVPDDMAWVEIDGDRLLAQLAMPHPEGAHLTFVVEQLVPSIILKELRGHAHGGGANVLGLANAFDTARALFEARFNPLVRDTGSPIMETGAFFTFLAESRDLYACYADAVRCADELAALLGENEGRFVYQPWLAPETRRQVTFVGPARDSGLTETVVEFDHPTMGLVRAEFLYRQDRVACRLKMQHMAHAKPLGRYLAAKTYPHLSAHTESPSITKLPKSEHGGIIAERLFRN